VAPRQSPRVQSLYGSRKPGVTNKFASIIRLINLLGDKSTNMDAANEYEDRNSPRVALVV